MRLANALVAPAIVVSGLVSAFVAAPSAVADCTSAGGTTICSQGDVRGSNTGDGPSGAGPVVPYPCENDWYCDDNWDLDIIVGPIRPGGPGGPGGGNRPGIGPR